MADIYRASIARVELDGDLVREHAGSLLATGDKLANRYGVEVYRGGKAVSIAAMALVGYFIRPEADTVVINGTTSGNTGYVELPQSCYTQEGAFTLALKLSGGDVVQTVRILDGRIVLTQDGDLIDPGETVPTLDDILGQIAACEAATTAANTAASAANNLVETMDYAAVSNQIDPAEIVADSRWVTWQSYASSSTDKTYTRMEIPVKAGVPYACRNYIDKDLSWWVPDGEDGVKLTTTGSTTVEGTSGQFVRMENFVPEKDGKLRITSRTYYNNVICLINSPTLPEYYSDYGVVRERTIGDARLGNAAVNVVTVAKDGTGDFDTISAAAEYARYHANTTVYVQGGVYDIIEEMGDAYFSAFTSSTSANSGIVLTNGVRMVFSSSALVTCNYTGSNAYVKSKFSPFVVDKGKHTGFTLENLHLEASNVRYCVHDDTGGQQTPYRNVYRNCHMYIDNTANTAWSAEMCIGGGVGAGTEVLIEGCWFGCGVTKGWNPKVVGYHNCDASWSPCRANIVIRDCYFDGVSTCGCSHYGEHSEMSRMMVTGCSLGAAPTVKFEDESAFDQENFELIAWDNTIRKEGYDAAAIVPTVAGYGGITVRDSADRPLAGLRICGKTVLGGTPSPESPVTMLDAWDGDSMTVRACGKNLLKGFNAYRSWSPYSWTADTDDNTKRLADVTAYLAAGKTYTLTISTDGTLGSSGDTVEVMLLKDGGYDAVIAPWDSGVSKSQTDTKIKMVFAPTVSGSYCLRLDINQGGATHAFWDVQIEEGGTATAYEEYRDGGRVIVYRLPLQGIPVTSGGNYTDEDGQQWICNEIDLERRVYVQRVSKLIMDGTENWEQGTTVDGRNHRYYLAIPDKAYETDHKTASRLMCGTYPAVIPNKAYAGDYDYGIHGENGSRHLFVCDARYQNDLTGFKASLAAKNLVVLYPLAEADETKLPDLLPLGYAGMQTQKPITNVTNDAGVGMALDYIADTQTYIDNKFAAIAAAMVDE